MDEDFNLILNTHMANLNGLVNGSDSNSWPAKSLPEPTDWFVYFQNCFTEDGFDPDLDEGSEIVVFNGLTLGVLDPDFKRYRVMEQDFRAKDHPEYQGTKVFFEGEISIADTEHLSDHKHDARSYALLELVFETFVSVQFGQTFDEVSKIDWELTRAVCEYLASEMTIHKSCERDCELKDLAKRVFTAFADLHLPVELQYRARNWSNGVYCPNCSTGSFIRSIIKPPRSLYDMNLTQFPELPVFEISEPVRYCLECGWES